MLTVLAISLSCFLPGILAYDIEEVCYGAHYHLPSKMVTAFWQGKLYFTPSSGEPRQLIGVKGEVMNPRFSMTHGSLSVRGVTEKDDGIFGVSFFKKELFHTRLRVKDCATTKEKHYKDSLFHSLIDLEYVEFGPAFEPAQVRVLWNRHDQDASSERAHMNRRGWELTGLTQGDNGVYNFRRQDKSIITRMKLIVKEYTTHYTLSEGMELLLLYPNLHLSDAFWTVTFRRDHTQVLMKEGRWVVDDKDYEENRNFIGRLQVERYKFTISPVQETDGGTYAFRDRMGHRILTMTLTVSTSSYGVLYGVVSFLLTLLLLLCCYCCLKRCGKDASKGSKEIAAPAVYYHDTTQPTGPTYSTRPHSASPAAARQPYRTHNPAISRGETPTRDWLAYHPVVVHDNPARPPLVSQDTTRPSTPTYSGHSYSASPAVAPSYRPFSPISSSGEGPSHHPATYSPVVVHENPPQTPPASQFTAPVPSLSTGSDWLSSDGALKFELKGVTFPSAPPLDSDSTTSDVYTSHKLTFL